MNRKQNKEDATRKWIQRQLSKTPQHIYTKAERDLVDRVRVEMGIPPEKYSIRREEIEVFNIEETMPRVEEARKILIEKLKNARGRGVKVLKIIHGYGSSGVGGALRLALRDSLLRRRKEGSVTNIIFGENWSISEANTRSALQQWPELRKDSDLNRSNRGITLVFLS